MGTVVGLLVIAVVWSGIAAVAGIWISKVVTRRDRPAPQAKDNKEQARIDVAFTEMISKSESRGLYDPEVTPCACGQMPPCRHLSDEGHP